MANKAQTTTQLYVTTRNEKGALAKCTIPLREKGINIEAVCAWEMDKNANFMFVTTDNTKAKNLLTQNGYTVQEKPAVWWNTANTPGALNRGTSALAERGINIYTLFASAGSGNQNCWVFLDTDNNNEAVKTLNSL